jgi:subtilisin family serine protease
VSLTYNKSNRERFQNRSVPVDLYNSEEKLLRTFKVYFDKSISPEEYCKRLLLTNPAVEIAEPCYVPQFMAYVPNDPLISNQHTNLELIKAYEAWAIEKGNQNVIIGISDSGTNQDHEDLNKNLAVNQDEIPNDGIDNDGNGYIDDYQGYNFSWKSASEFPGDTYNNSNNHGQQVAGILGASTDNSLGIAGIGFNCSIFPMKIIEGNSLKYAYESILYAAILGVKVLNCSWGVVKPYSDIDQSIINYALSMDVSIVAAAGNTSNKVTKYDIFYPASYYGVLGVGEVNSNDRLTSSSSISLGCRILAPGEGNMTTTNQGYSECDGGTSFASPVIAGAVGLFRSKYPELSALQAIEFVRQSVDIHPNFSNNDKALIPGRINLLKMLTIDPMSIPAVVPELYTYYDQNGEETDRFKSGDKAFLRILATNVLGNANNLNFTLSVAFDPTSSVAIENSEISLATISNNETVLLEGFSIKINNNFTGNVILRVDITDENGYTDFFKFAFIPTREISTFYTDNIKFSMSDFGEFGFSTNTSNIGGYGFNYKNFGNQVYRNSSVMVSAQPDKLIYNSSVNQVYGFSPVKSFISPQRHLGIYNDSKSSSNKIGVEITQSINIFSPKSKAARLEFKIKNTGDESIEGLALGLYLDWDIGTEPSLNRTRLFEDAIPNEYKGKNAAAQIAYIQTEYPYFGSASYSSNPNDEAQAAGLDFNYIGNFNRANRFLALNSGTSIQTDLEDDIGSLVGIKFSEPVNPDDERECVICIGAGDNESELSEVLKNCLLGITSVEDFAIENNPVMVYPNPANDVVFIQLNENSSRLLYQLYDNLGNSLITYEYQNGLNAGDRIGFDISGIRNGIYILHLSIDGKLQTYKIVVAR